MRTFLRWSAVFVLAMVLPCASLRAAEPEWDGRPLSYWIGLLREVPKHPGAASTDWRKAPWALSRIGVASIPAIVATLDSPNPEVRLRAIRPLVAMGSTASDAAKTLTVHLKDDDPRVRQWSAVALGTIGPAAVAALPTLATALKDDDATVRQAAAAALGNLDSGDAIEPLEAATEDPSEAVQRAARLALERLRPPSPKP
jgi:HEAT repeat protein